MAVRNLNKILRPGCIAVVGASNNPARMSHLVLKNLLGAGFEGGIYPVHPRDAEVQGLPAFPSLADLPEPAHLAIVCTRAETVPEIVQQGGESCVGGMLIVSAGFREIGQRGQHLENQIRSEAARFPDLRILGPNSLGIVVPHLNLNASFAAATPKPGGVAFVSQSATLCTSALDWAIQEDVGFSHFVSTGNMLEVGVGDLIDYFAADPYTDSIVLYVESITEARSFMSAARAIAKEKPIVVYKAGRFSESAQAAASHTGSICGVDAVYAAAFERAGILRVFEIDDMFDCAQLLARERHPIGPRLAIVTNAGGPGVVATDSLIDCKGELAKLSEGTLAQLDELLPPHWSRANPVDILADALPDRFRRALEMVLHDRGVDAALVILTPQAVTDPTATARVVADVAKRCKKPVLAAWMGGRSVRDGIEVLNEAGITTYNTPKNAVHAFMHLMSYARNRETLLETPREVPVSFPFDRPQQKQFIESLVAGQPDMLSEQTSKRLLSAYGIRNTEPQVAADPQEAVSRAREIGYPVALKIVSPQIPHKNEVSGVVLHVTSDQEVRAEFDRIVKSAAQQRPEAEIQGVSVQPMATAPDGIELIMGSRKDAVFGAVILIGMGGVAAEVTEDFALGLPPLNERLARRMLESLRLWPILAGHRQRSPVDVDQLLETLIRFSYLVADCPQISEMDVNPLLVTPRDVIALDARVRIDRSHPPGARPFSHLAIRPYPEHLVRPTRLANETPLILRPIRPEDEPAWHRMLRECSPESIRFRFRSMFKEMSHELATRFCFMDYDRELAIVAEFAGKDSHQLVGVGHLFCDVDHDHAEFAVLVPDAWQRQGVGSLITETCLQIAADWGLSEVFGETERLNSGMLATFRKTGFELHYDATADLVRARKEVAKTRVPIPSK